MKIGIITQPLENNYGGLLQNYALQTVLKEMGHEVITIDQEYPQPSLCRLIASNIKTLLLKLVGRDRKFIFLLNKRQQKYISQNTSLFIDKYIDRTLKADSEKRIRQIAASLLLEIYIVGSDQVWRPCYNLSIYIPFLSFAKLWKVKRIAYAASFGIDKWEFTPLQTKRCRNLIQLFDAVSVREFSGIELCQQYLDVNACQVLDPTMLLNASDYIHLVEQEHEAVSDGSLFTYILDSNESKQSYINHVTTELNLIPFSTMPELKISSETLKDIDKCVYPSVTKWLRGFMDAKLVICDSFHGAVFSIIFNKEFVVLANEQRGMARFYSLLNTYGLEERLVTDWNDISIAKKTIDWSAINKVLEERKKISKKYLLNSLC